MKYVILSNHSAKKLMDEVEEYLEKGWKCQGGVAMNKGNNEILQAMTKKDKDK